MTSSTRRRIVIAEDHPSVGASLKALLEADYEVVDLVADGAAVADTVRRHRPDAVLLDLWLPHRNGLDLISELHQDLPEVRIVVLTMHADIVVAVEAMSRGARAYLLKDSGYDELTSALAEVFDGKAYLSPRVTGEAKTTIYKDRAEI